VNGDAVWPVPLALLAVLAVSYVTRPASRRIPEPRAREPRTATSRVRTSGSVPSKPWRNPSFRDGRTGR
jgi:hypothetical protein